MINCIITLSKCCGNHEPQARDFRNAFCRLGPVQTSNFTLPNLMQIRENNRFFSFAFGTCEVRRLNRALLSRTKQRWTVNSLEKFSRSSRDCIIHVSVLLLMIKISQSAHENSLSYCKKKTLFSMYSCERGNLKECQEFELSNSMMCILPSDLNHRQWTSPCSAKCQALWVTL